jgi:hypothetical protein
MHCGGVTKRICYFKESHGDFSPSELFLSLRTLISYVRIEEREWNYEHNNTVSKLSAGS